MINLFSLMMKCLIESWSFSDGQALPKICSLPNSRQMDNALVLIWRTDNGIADDFGIDLEKTTGENPLRCTIPGQGKITKPISYIGEHSIMFIGSSAEARKLCPEVWVDGKNATSAKYVALVKFQGKILMLPIGLQKAKIGKDNAIPQTYTSPNFQSSLLQV